MKYNFLGNSDLQVSTICLGTMTFGQQNDAVQAQRQLDYAIDQGINFIDTAEMYPVPPDPHTVHQTEIIVGQWLKKKQRDNVIIATKVTGAGRNMGWIRDGVLAFDADNIRSAVDGSLSRLQTDYIDLYQLHWPERNTPMFGQYLFDPLQERSFTPFAETLQALKMLVDEGKIRYVGVSNEWPWGIMQFLNAAKSQHLPRIVSVQNAYNLINRTFETALLEMCYREQISLLAYSPLAFGHLSGKYLMPEGQGRVRLFKNFGQRYEKPAVIPAVKAYADVAAQFHLSPAQFAQAFVYSRWFTGSTIIGATSMAQLQENIQAQEVNWSMEMEQAVQQVHLQYFNPAP